MESDLAALLQTLCPRVFPDIAPTTAQKPYVTYQGIGGRSLRYVDNTAADKRHHMVQVNVWATTRKEANQLSRAIEDALCAASVFTARPMSEAVADVEDEDLRGNRQDFDIWAPR